MNVLVLNAGSSSQKTCLYRLPDDPSVAPASNPPAPLWKAQTEEGDADGLAPLLRTLWEGTDAVISGPSEIHAVGHRIVHGGAEFRESVRVTADVKDAIHRLAPLAPSHNPAALAGIKASEKLLGQQVPQFAVFDTAFHRTLPDAAAIYPGPYAWAEQGIRRFGFHGINHQYVAERAALLIGRSPDTLNLISCHLGNGCSLAAIRGGVSIDTTMGFTPLDGLMMGTRSGAVDPGLLLYLQREQGVTVQELDTLLNHESGLKGISGISEDMREIATAIAQGNARARLALDIYIHRLRAGIGAMRASLDHLDALIFTAGVGEHSAEVRARVCAGLDFLKIALNQQKNDSSGGSERDIAADDAPVRVLVIQAEEDWAIARECFRLLHV